MIRIAGKLLAGLSLLLALGSSVAAGADKLANKFHVILVTDTNADIGTFCAEDRDLLVQVLKEAFENADSEFQNRYQVTRIERGDVTPEKILKKIKEVQVDPEDAVLFYYTGHGGLDPKKGHFLATSGGDLLRSKIRAALLDKQPRMLAIITDSCSSRSVFTPHPRQIPAKWRVIRDLFFVQTGVADIQSSQENVVSWCGVFTSAFAANLCKQPELIDRNKDGFVDWNEFFTAIRDDTLANFKLARDNSSSPTDEIRTVTPQEPYPFNLPTKAVVPDAVMVLPGTSQQRTFTAIAASGDGSKLLTGDNDGRLRLWDPATGKEVRVFEKPSQFVWSIALSADGRYALSNDLFHSDGRGENITRVWDIGTGQQLHRITTGPPGKGSCFLDSDRIAFLSDDGKLTVWNLPNNNAEKTFSINGKYAGRFATMSLDGGEKLRLVDSNPATCKCWVHTIAVETEREMLQELPLALRPFTTNLSSDGKVVALATSPQVNMEGVLETGRRAWQVELWDCDKLERRKVIRDLRGDELRIAVSSKGQFFAVAAREQTGGYEDTTWADYPLTTDLQVWDLAANKQVLRVGDLPPQDNLSRCPRGVVFVEDGQSIAIAYGSEVRVYKLPTPP